MKIKLDIDGTTFCSEGTDILDVITNNLSRQRDGRRFQLDSAATAEDSEILNLAN